MNAILKNKNPSELTVEEIISNINHAKQHNKKYTIFTEELMLRAKDFIDENSFITYSDEGKEFVGKILFHVKEENWPKNSSVTRFFDTTIKYVKSPFKIEEESFNHRFSERYFTQVKEASKVEVIAALMNMRCTYRNFEKEKLTDIFAARNYEFFTENIKKIAEGKKDFDKNPEFSENYFLIGITPATRSKNGWINDKIIYKPVITEKPFNECYLESTIKNLIKDDSFKEMLSLPKFDGYAIDTYSVPKIAQDIVESNSPMRINLTYRI